MLEQLLTKLDIERGDWELQERPTRHRLRAACVLSEASSALRQVQTTFPNLMPASCWHHFRNTLTWTCVRTCCPQEVFETLSEYAFDEINDSEAAASWLFCQSLH